MADCIWWMLLNRLVFVFRSQRPLNSDIFVLKHESSIFRSFIQPCMWFLHDGTGQTLCCLAHEILAWHFQNNTQGRLNDLNMLPSCFWTKTSALISGLLLLPSSPLPLLMPSSSSSSVKLSVFSSSSTPSLTLLTTYGKFRLRGNSGNSIFGGSSSRMKRLFNR